MKLQTLNKNRKTELYFEILELFTGVFLVGFLGIHLLFESTIMVDYYLFNSLSSTLDRYFLPHIGIPMLILILLIHFLVVVRRIPVRIQEQRIILQHAKRLAHLNTWAWLIQVITGMIILIIASIHVWVVVSNWPIDALSSAHRVASGYLWLYLLLLPLAVTHAGIGLYRQFVKWAWFPRKPVGIVLGLIGIGMTMVGLATIITFMRVGAGTHVDRIATYFPTIITFVRMGG